MGPYETMTRQIFNAGGSIIVPLKTYSWQAASSFVDEQTVMWARSSFHSIAAGAVHDMGSLPLSVKSQPENKE